MRSSAKRVPRPSNPADVLDLMLDQGIRTGAHAPVGLLDIGLLGIEGATINACVVTRSVDSLREYAEAVNRLDLGPAQKPKGLPELLAEGIEGTAKTTGRRELDRPAQTVIEGELDRPTERVEQLIEKVTGGGFVLVPDCGVPASRRAPSRG